MAMRWVLGNQAQKSLSSLYGCAHTKPSPGQHSERNVLLKQVPCGAKRIEDCNNFLLSSLSRKGQK